jgi:RNA polymerase sigma-70 factor (ECF subfamily)
MTRKLYSEEELAKFAVAFREGDPDAFSALYDHFADNIYRYVYYKVKSSESEDLTEIIFIKAWENRKKYDPSKSSFSSWIYTIARNTIIDHYRVFKNIDELSIDLTDHDEAKNPKLNAESVLNAEKVREAISKLTDSYKEILLLRFIEDLEYSEIAKVMGKSEGSIRIMQFRAMKELKQVLQKMGFNE